MGLVPQGGVFRRAQDQPRPLASCEGERVAVWEGLPSCTGGLGEANTQGNVGAGLVVLPQ